MYFDQIECGDHLLSQEQHRGRKRFPERGPSIGLFAAFDIASSAISFQVKALLKEAAARRLCDLPTGNTPPAFYKSFPKIPFLRLGKLAQGSEAL